ncbi:trypsin-like peptidase domain-containing protein (plasmid) [Streptomyces sp. P10-4]
MTVSEPSVAVSVFQVLASDGGIAGAGFLAGEDTGFTCAHVVRAAGQLPGDQVEVLFPHLPGAPRVMADVVAERWRAPEAEDVAVLRFGSIPATARRMAVGTSAGCQGHGFFSFGFPAQALRGGHFGYGEVGGLLPGDNGAQRQLQLTKANDLTAGFSGGPVVDKMTGLVIGMVNSIVSPDIYGKGLGIAYATPAEVLREIHPQLAEDQACPYLGLEPFTAEHADWFHGREAAVERVLTALGSNRRLLMLLGPSGAGKSSLVNAGVLPALAKGAIPGSDRWLCLGAHPGQDLLAELERAGLPGAATEGLLSAVETRLAAAPDHDHLLLVIDQFEELLTQAVPPAHRPLDDGRLRAADQLMELCASHTAVTVLLVMRNDFYAPLDALAPDLMNAVLPGLCNVPATLSRPELKAIITRPAAAVGLSIEAGLADRIVDDVLDAGSAARQAPVTLLPALELALRQLWARRRREDGRITHAAYEKIGKVTGSLTAWCNRALDQLPADQRPTAQRILTALVRPADETNGIPATRRSVPLTRLRVLASTPKGTGPAGDAAFDEVLAVLTRYRIVTTGTSPPSDTGLGEPAADLIHDALLRDWADLRDWVAEDHQFQVWLVRAAEQQVVYTNSALPGDLLSGSLLAEGEEWAGRRSLPAEITSLLNASRQHRQAAVRRTQRINVVLAVMLALALLAAGAAFHQQRAATAAQHEAQSRQLAAQSANLAKSDPDLASLLAVKAWQTSHTEEAAAALYGAPATLLRHRLAAHTQEVDSVAFSPDGSTLATESSDGTARLWDVKRGTSRATLAHTSAVAFSPDGSTLATGSVDGAVHLRDAMTGRSRTVLTGHAYTVMAVAFSPDGALLATAGWDGTAHLLDAKSGRLRTSLPVHARYVTSVVFSPDGTTLATHSVSSDNEDRLSLWDTRTGALRATHGGGERSLAQWMAFDRRSTTLTTDCADSTCTWSARTGRRLTKVTLDWVVTSPEGGARAVSSDGRTYLWDARSSRVRATIADDYMQDVETVAFSPDGSTLAVGGGGGPVRLWDVKTGQSYATLTGHTKPVETLAFSPDGTTLATGSKDGTVRLWDTRVGVSRATFTGPSREVTSVAFSPDGTTLATGGDEGSTRLWDVRTERPRVTLAGHTEGVSSIVFGHEGSTLTSASWSGGVRQWDSKTGTLRLTNLAHRLPGYRWAVKISPDGATFGMTGNDGVSRADGTTHLWDVTSGRHHAKLDGSLPTSGMNSVAFSPDSTTLAMGGARGALHLWDARTGRHRAAFTGTTEDMTSVAFSPDNNTLATGSKDGTTHLWDVQDGASRATLTGHIDAVTALAFSPDGDTLATGSEDGALFLWDARTGKRRATFTGHIEGINSLAFSPDGVLLAAGGEDGTTRLWNADLPDAHELAGSICRRLHRDFTKAETAQYLRGQDVGPVCPGLT